MSTNNRPPSLGEELRAYNRRCDLRLRKLTGMSLQTFKIIKAFSQFSGILLGGYALLFTQIDPEFALVFIGLMWAGPEGLELLLSRKVNRHGRGGRDSPPDTDESGD